MPPLDILALPFSDFLTVAQTTIPEASGAAKDIYASVFKNNTLTPEALGLGPEKSSTWKRAFYISQLKVENIQTEQEASGETAKVLFKLEDGLGIEAVRIPMATRLGEAERGTLCISSQAGCRMGCAFCETGRHGLKRSLKPGEIVAQVITARVNLGWQFRNIVFMGMGEPLDNLEAVLKAIEVLRDRQGLGIAMDRISLCTSGYVPGIRRLAQLGPSSIRLSISLNSGIDTTRSKLMPINRQYPLAELKEALAEYPRPSKVGLALNYCLIPGFNDSAKEAHAVAEFCKGLGKLHINLIPYNPGPQPIARIPGDDEIAAFEALLKNEGLVVRRRATHGRNILAACGQLGAQKT